MTDENVLLPDPIPGHWMLCSAHPDSPLQQQLDRIEQDVRRALAGTAGDRWAMFSDAELSVLNFASFDGHMRDQITAELELRKPRT